MPVTPSYPGIYIEELPSSARTITPAPTSITVFIGYTHPFQGECATTGPAGRWGEAIQIFNFTEYERYFGGLYRSPVVNSDVADAVYQFFLNGGSNAYVVGLRPAYYTPSGPGVPVPVFIKHVDAASGSIAGIKFTAKQLTDAGNAVSITIRNFQTKGTTANNTADILITYGSRVETYRDVVIESGLAASVAAPELFITRKLENSALVKIEPAGVSYPSSYTGAAPPTPLTLDLGDMPPPAGGAAYTPFRGQDFTDVLKPDAPLDKVDVFNLLVIPGVSDSSIWTKALDYCEKKLAFFVMDPPEDATADGMGTSPPLRRIQEVVDDPSMPRNSPNGALYFPYLKTIDPLSGRTLRQPPSGFVAGIYARTDLRRGVWKAPAGLEASIANTVGVVDEGKMTDMRQGVVNEKGVNVLRFFPGSGTVVWGARGIAVSSAFQQWRYVPVRRTALFIEQTLLRNLGWVVFEPNDEPLWASIRVSIDGFMLSLFNQQAFQGSTPSQAFLVQCDATTTTQTDIDKGIVNIVVGFRPLKPAEFVIIKIAQLTGQVQ
jgi:phage tail sheath protein FI